ncbi:HAMP domain-containing histidine kinase [Novosphingobium sp. AAP83]|uniref:HAMP domain-containing histidine kinase n=1 Tax=Novosphingobium sp. AAP83 TaxID=1523425 RepID=UPI0018D1415E|nr:HAMP domain-containing histidine kinase [Novosphingobium sp. AAP83]
MIVDDRLETVLRTNAAGKLAGRTQLRQLIDLVGAVPLSQWSERHASALDRIDSLADALPVEECAAILRGTSHRSAVLVYHFAQSSPRIASAIIASARLPEDDWIALIPRLPTTARGFLRHRTDLGERVRDVLARLGVNDFLLPEPEAEVASNHGPVMPVFRAPEPKPEPAPPSTQGEGVGAIVRRIEAFRRKRAERDAALLLPRADGVAPLLPFGEVHTSVRQPPLSIDLRTNAEGMVVHAGVDPAGMLIGSRLFATDLSAPVHCDEAMAGAFRQRQPIVAGRLAIAGADYVAGQWQADGTPIFSRDSNSFTGYLLRLRRPMALAFAAPSEPQITPEVEADRLRQLLHELRTPINAIQGFAEVIQQQVFGQTPHQYRAMAASIAADAAQMLAGFEEVERLVKLESRAMGIEDGEANAAAIIARMVEQVTPVLTARNVRLDVTMPPEPLTVSLAPDEVERSVWRVLSVIASSVAPGERLAITLEPQPDLARLTITLPASLQRLDDAALFAPDGSASGGSFAASAMLGNGFSLRLARAELEAGGGALRRDEGLLLIGLPTLTGNGPDHTLEADDRDAGRQSFSG